jgi:hypothetical protein
MLAMRGHMLTIVMAVSLAIGSHVRSTDATIGAVLAEGLHHSDVVRRLVEVIDASNVIVYLARGDCPRPAIACLMMAGGGPDFRYIRINFILPVGLGKAGGWYTRELAVAIAHELQHAAEIAAWPEVIDGPTLQAAYARRRLDRGASHLDTEAAVDAGDERRAELMRERRRASAPCSGGEPMPSRGGHSTRSATNGSTCVAHRPVR